MSYGVYRASLPYITNKPILCSNNNENQLSISTSEASTIYYTIDGSKPTTKSPKYTRTLLINNNTQSPVNIYQPPQIITPSIAIISSTWNNDVQKLTFNFNKVT